MVLSLPDSNLTFDQPPHLAKKLAECQDVKDCEVCVARVDHILDVHVSNHGGNRPDPTPSLNNNFNKTPMWTYNSLQEGQNRLIRQETPQKRMPEPILWMGWLAAWLKIALQPMS